MPGTVCRILAVCWMGVGLASGPLVSQQACVVPSSYAAADAPSLLWLAGVSEDLRQQVLVDATHLQPLQGRLITALSWRRNASADLLQGGSVTMTVRLAHSPRSAADASMALADNLGLNPVQVFQGQVTVPTSPPAPGPTATWSSDVVVRLVLQQGFLYLGGTLCIDVAGISDPTSPVAWWPMDAAWDTASGGKVDVGVGCGPYAGSSGRWSTADPRSLVPGGTGLLTARGTPGGLAFLVFAVGAQANALDLRAAIGAPAGCYAHLSGILFSRVTQFGPLVDPQAPDRGGQVTWRLSIPNEPWALAATFAIQWLDATAFAASNAVVCTVSSVPSTLGMTTVQAGLSDTAGTIMPNVAHVLRFEF
jgi:hypothetical protein